MMLPRVGMFRLLLAISLAWAPLAIGAESIDVSYVGSDAIAAAVLHPRHLLTDPRYEYFPSEIIIAACEENFGIDPRKIELAIATLALEGLINGEPSFGAILHFHEPYDQQALKDRMGPNAKEESADDKKYWVIPDGSQAPLCIAMPTEKVLLLGTEPHLTKMLTAGNVDSPLTKLLKKADSSKSLVAVLDFSAVRPMLLLAIDQMGDVPPPFAPYLEIPKLLKSIQATLELNPLALEFLFGADDLADAAKFKELIDVAKKLAGEMIEQQMSVMPAGEDSPTGRATMQYMKRMTKALLDAIKVDAEGENVRIAMSAELAPAAATSGVLAALLLPAIQSAREAARRAQTSNNLKQIALALLNYHDAHGTFPARAIRDEDGKPLLSWRVAILPFLEQQALYEQFHLDEPWDSEHNRELLAKMPQIYASPNLAEPEKTVYLGIDGEGTIFGGEEGVRIQRIRDGTSNTILAVEANADRAVPWTKPEDLGYDPDDPLAGLGKLRPGGFSALFGDGSVRFIQTNNFDLDLLRAYMTINGREPIRQP